MKRFVDRALFRTLPDASITMTNGEILLSLFSCTNNHIQAARRNGSPKIENSVIFSHQGFLLAKLLFETSVRLHYVSHAVTGTQAALSISLNESR